MLRQSYPDVSHSSLRFLEREGLIAPARTAGGHRLFSPTDIDRVRQIKAWQAQRLSIEEVRQCLAASSMLGAPHTLATRFLQAVLDGSPEAHQIVLQADDLGMPLIALFQDVLQPVLVEVGERWMGGSLRVGQEHEVTEIARDVVAELSRRHAVPSHRGPSMLAASVPGERHDLGLRMVVALLRASGRQVHFLGADVDIPFLLQEVAAREPEAVLLSVTLEEHIQAAREAARALVESARPTPRAVLLGGQAIRHCRQEVHQWGVTPLSDSNLATALQTILHPPGTPVVTEDALAG